MGLLGKTAKAAKGLLMDTPSRMARAKEQGFGDQTYYHGTNADIDAFDKSKVGSKTDSGMYGDGFYLTDDPSYASTYAGEGKGGNVIPAKVRLTNPYIINSQSDIPDIDIPSNTMDDLENADKLYSKGFRELLESKGYDGVIDKTGATNQVVVFDPKNIRSTNARFDPAKTGSSNLIASNPVATTGAGILGLGAAAQSNDTYADYSPSNLARLQSSDVGGYQAPQHPRLASAAMGAGQLNQRGVDDALMQFIAPRLPSELMGKIAYNDERGLLDRIKASAGLLGLY
jgi:hypothetical protein